MRCFSRVPFISAAILVSCMDNERGSGGAGAGGSEGGAIATGGTLSGTMSIGGMTTNGTAMTGGAGGEPGPPCDVDGVTGTCIDTAFCVGDYVPIPNHCPGPVNIQCCVPAEAVTCDPESVPLPNAGLTEPPGLGGCPPGMAPAGGFCIDRFEASLVYADDGASVSPYFNPGMDDVIAVSIQGAVPQGYITGEQASDACLRAGKRLCTDIEWLRACRGSTQTIYPYGSNLMLGVCNDHRAQHPAVEYFMTTDPWIYSELDHPCLNQLRDSLDKTGANAGCVTEDGMFDMMGNVHEWTADPNGSFRGGFYVDTMLNGPGCTYVTTAHDTYHYDYSTGFRCCADP
jgi:formylglycine-generating enzyme